ncbi:MAG: metalloprotease TldD [Rhodobacteraceae bacterium]|nr:MAG: metalloprotease TldD [Paracoccaceae bacterium]
MSEIVATFNPFNDRLDYDATLTEVQHALSGANDGELYLESSRNESLTYDDGRLRTTNYNASEGFGLRAVAGELIGYSHSSTINEKEIKNAGKTVKLIVSGNSGKNKEPERPSHNLYTMKDPMISVTFDKKVELLKEIDDYARTLDNRIVQVTTNFGASIQEVVILRIDGSVRTDTRPMARINVNIIVEQNGRRESGSSGAGGRFDLALLLKTSSWKTHVSEALRVALVNLKSIPAPAGIMDVVLGPGWPGVLLHEAVGHGLEGDFNRKKSSAFSSLMGKKIASEIVTIVDDGTLSDRRGSINIDDEGTTSARNTLISDGRLVSLMYDRQNAHLMGVQPTGNGRRQSYRHTPLPRMTNTFMVNGNEDPKNIVQNLKDGIYATGFSGGQVDITNGKFVFSCTEAYKVVNGAIQEPLKGATLIGDGATALTKIRAVGNNLSLDPGIGNCGKAGQWVPVGVGQPTLLISGLTIGGSRPN